MASLKHFLGSQIAKKIIMSLTGLALIAFLIVHLAGNLLIFGGADLYNTYSHILISNPFIVAAELILLAFFIGHFVNGIILTIRNRHARIPYKKKKWADYTSRKSLSSSTMILSGLLILIFVPIHLWVFKYGTYYTSTTTPEVRDIHRLVIEEFHEPIEIVWYSIAMIVIGFHLWHAFGSAFESLGVRYRKTVHRIGHALAILIAGGFLIIPLAIYFMTGD